MRKKERVQPPRGLEKDVLDPLSVREQSPLNDGAVFQTKQKGMMFAAAVGYCLHAGRMDEVDSDELTGEGIKLDYFRDSDEEFIDALAVTVRGDLSIMDPARQPERVEIFEKCAYLGLQEMKRACFDERPDYPLLGILALVDAMTQSEANDLPGLSDLI